MAVSFVDCRADHLPSLRAFFARMYRPDYVLLINNDLFHWQFGEAPAGKEDEYHIKLALINGEVVGCLGYIPIEVSLGGQVVRGAWLANWMVGLEQRRLGLGPLLMREVTRQFDVTLNVGPNQDARDLLSRMGWIDFGELARYVCVLNVQAARALTETGKLEWPPGALPGEWEPPQATAVSLVDCFSDEATQLWDTVWGTRSAGARRSAEFLNWRYADHPVFNYRLLEAHTNERLSGLAVYRVEQVRDLPTRVGRIVELISEADVERELLRAVLSDAQSQGVAVLDYFCSSQRFCEVLTQHGFLSSEDEITSQIPVLFQPIDRQRTGISFMAHLSNVPDVSKAHDWYVTKADADQDRPN